MLLLLAPAPAWADMGMLMAGVANRRMPFDPPLTAATSAYSTRRLFTAYTANKGIRVVRASDSTQSDIGFLADGSPDSATLVSFCAATTCKLVTAYAQTGARDLTQATDLNRPTITVSCLNSRACWVTSAAGMAVAAAANFTPATGVMAFSVVGNRTAGTGACYFMASNGGSGNRISGGSAIANRFAIAPGFNALANDNTWHTAEGNLNISAGSTPLGIDGVDTVSTGSGNTTAGVPEILGVASTTCLGVEGAFWDNIALSNAERLLLNSNQRAFWGF